MEMIQCYAFVCTAIQSDATREINIGCNIIQLHHRLVLAKTFKDKWMHWEALLQCVETMKGDIKVRGNKTIGSLVNNSLVQPSDGFVCIMPCKLIHK